MFVFLHRWSICVSNAASDYNGFGFAVAHEYIKDNFNEEAKQEVNKHVSKNWTFVFILLTNGSRPFGIKSKIVSQNLLCLKLKDVKFIWEVLGLNLCDIKYVTKKCQI